MRPRRTTSALVGLLLAGVAAAPAAHAHTHTARPEQWHLDAMKARDIWRLGTGQGVTVAVIDTGVARIPELDGQVVRGKDFSHGYEGDERTDYGHHGTGIAALIAGTGKRPSGGGGSGWHPGPRSFRSASRRAEGTSASISRSPRRSASPRTRKPRS